jgi:ADP-ribosyl-[dinitrogen reductase] hydrolase
MASQFSEKRLPCYRAEHFFNLGHDLTKVFPQPARIQQVPGYVPYLCNTAAPAVLERALRTTLSATVPSPLTLADRYRGALLGLAAGDALGTSVEFSEPGSFTPLHDMVGGGPFGLKPGEWTDDTSMALCLAESLLDTGRFDAADQMRRYLSWWRTGRLSSHGRCFDIGNTVRLALERFEATGSAYAPQDDSGNAGNGSLMRLAPVPLFYAAHRAEAVARAGESSMTTHGSVEARDACRVLAALIVGALQGLSKKDLLSETFFESFLESADPLSPRVAEVARGSFARKQPPEIRGTSYVVQTLEAALWAFANSSSFQEGALKAVNLGDDADTTGAVFGQLAGAHYGASGIPVEWRKRLAHGDVIERFAMRLFEAAIAPVGSRKHVLDLTTGRSVARVGEILRPIGARLSERGPIRPSGYRQAEECTLPDFVRLCGLDQHFTKKLGMWNTAAETKGPTWNLLGLLETDNGPGLLLVDASARRDDLNGTAESAVAAAYLVASCGLHAVLLFLGFVGDDYFADQFADSAGFEADVRRHLAALIPSDAIGRRVPHGSGGSMSVLIESLPVREPSGRL